MLVFVKNTISLLLFILFISSISLYAADTTEMSQEEIKRYFIEHHLKQEPTQEALEQLDYDLKHKVEPILKAQVEKYHPGFELQWQLDFPQTKYHWAATENNEIVIPLSSIENFITKEKSLWSDLGFFHHEITHIKQEHLRKEQEYELLLQEKHTGFLEKLFFPISELINICKRSAELEADAGVPNHRLILKGLMLYFESIISKPSGPYHPTHKERANYFQQRLDECIRTRNQNVQKFFGINPILAKIPHINFPSAPKLLGINSDCYEAMLDLIGEHQQKVDH